MSTAVTEEQWRCLIDRGSAFAVVRAYRNKAGGMPDSNCPATVAAALAAGISVVDVYHFPVSHGKPAAVQATECLAYLAEHGVRFGRLWLDIEGSTGNGTWATDVVRNVDFIAEFLGTLQHAGVPGGIYCGTGGWKEITGDCDSLLTDAPLWWSSHGKSFTPFGCWTAPRYVQYAYNTAHCGITYDSNYCDLPLVAPET